MCRDGKEVESASVRSDDSILSSAEYKIHENCILGQENPHNRLLIRLKWCINRKDIHSLASSKAGIP